MQPGTRRLATRQLLLDESSRPVVDLFECTVSVHTNAQVIIRHMVHRESQARTPSAIWPATGAGWNATASTVICRSTTTQPNVPSGRLSLAERTSSSVARPKVPLPAHNFTAWSKLPKPTAKSPMRGCAAHWNTCRSRPQWRTTKRCCRGIARLKYIAKCSTHRGSGGV